jgi:hypothetical protein
LDLRQLQADMFTEALLILACMEGMSAVTAWQNTCIFLQFYSQQQLLASHIMQGMPA